jgi:hypothetical protein
MSRIRGAVLVVCMLVVSSIAAASALAALPEFEGPFPIHFTALQLGTGVLATIGTGKVRTVECKHGSALGFIQGPKDALVNSIIYKECKSTTFGANCNSAGAAAGEIVTLPLLGLLGYINKAKPLVGLLFEPHSGGNHFASFECTGLQKLTVTGRVICDLSPVNIITKDYHLNCVAKNGIQEPLSFEGGPKNFLTTQGSGLENFTEQSGVTALSDVLTLTLTLILA